MATDQPINQSEPSLIGEGDPLAGRVMLGAMLRRVREENHETLRDVAARADLDVSTLSRFERGERAVQVIQVRGLMMVYGVTDEQIIANAEDLIKRSASSMWWGEFQSVIPKGLELLLRMETAATRVRSISTNAVEGLCQTRRYAEAINANTRVRSDATESRIRRVDLRMARQRLLAGPVQLDVLLDEAVLHRVVGGPEVMRDQIDHLSELATHPGVDLRVLPFACGAYPGLFGNTTILDAPGQRLVYCESTVGNSYVMKPQDVDGIEEIFTQATRLALTSEASKDLLRKTVMKYGV
jgi:transcriptional regulator with XRE-family HTH domain